MNKYTIQMYKKMMRTMLMWKAKEISYLQDVWIFFVFDSEVDCHKIYKLFVDSSGVNSCQFKKGLLTKLIVLGYPVLTVYIFISNPLLFYYYFILSFSYPFILLITFNAVEWFHSFDWESVFWIYRFPVSLFYLYYVLWEVWSKIHVFFTQFT